MYQQYKHQQKQLEQRRISIILRILKKSLKICSRYKKIFLRRFKYFFGCTIETPFYLVHHTHDVCTYCCYYFSLFRIHCGRLTYESQSLSLTHSLSDLFNSRQKIQHNNNDAMMSSWALSKKICERIKYEWERERKPMWTVTALMARAECFI